MKCSLIRHFLLDPSANLARRPRQRLADPDFQLVLLLAAQATRAALVAEARQALNPLLLVQPMPGADRVVVQQQHLRHGFAAHAVVQQHQRVRSPGQTMRGRPVSSQLDQILPRFAVQEPRPYHQPGRIRFAPLGKGTGRILMESRYILNYSYGVAAGMCVRSLISIGLDPCAGFLHADRTGRYSLAYDLMELLRPEIDL